MAIISFDSYTKTSYWVHGGTKAYLRFIVKQTFTSKEGARILKGTYFEVECTVDGTTLTIPALSLNSTLDSEDVPSAYYEAVLFDHAKIRRATFIKKLQIPTDFGTTGVDWEDILGFNGELQEPLSSNRYRAILDTIKSKLTLNPFSIFMNKDTTSKEAASVTLSSDFVLNDDDELAINPGFVPGSMDQDAVQEIVEENLTIGDGELLGSINGGIAVGIPLGTGLAFENGALKSTVETTGGADELDQLSDVVITTPQNDDFFVRVAGVFKNLSLASVKILLGINNVNNTSDANKPVSIAQAAADALVQSNAAADATTKANAAITTIRNGVVSAGDDLNKLYNKLIALEAIIADGVSDGDSIVDTVSEILQIFSTYPEGANIVTALGDKINTSAIINTLTETTSGKVLDARQGKALKDLIDALTTTVTTLTTTVGGKMDKSGGTFTGAVNLVRNAYGSGWNNSSKAAAEGDIYTKIQALELQGSGVSDTLVTGDAASVYDFSGNTGSTPPDGLAYGSLFGATTTGCTVSNTNNRLEITVPALNGRGTGCYFNPAIDFEGKMSSVKIVQVLGYGTVDRYTGFGLRKDSSNYVNFLQLNGILFFKMVSAGVETSTQTTYLNATHVYWRIKHTGSEFVWETSQNGSDWTEQRRATAGFTVSSVQPYIGCDSAGTTSITPAYFDDWRVEETSGASYLVPNTVFGQARISSWVNNTFWQNPLGQASNDLGGSTLKTLLIDVDINVPQAVTIPANIRLVPSGGIISKTSTGSITFLGPGVRASTDQQIFSGFAAGEIKWTGNYPQFFSPVWFGAKADNSTDNLVPFNSVIAAMQTDFGNANARRGGTIIIPPGANKYYCSDVWQIYRPVIIDGLSTKIYGTEIRFGANKGGIKVHGYNTYLGTPPGGTKTAADETQIKNLTLTGEVTEGSLDTITGNLSMTGSEITFTRTSGASIVNPLRKLQCIRYGGFSIALSKVTRVVDGHPTGELRFFSPQIHISGNTGSNELFRQGTNETFETNVLAGCTLSIRGATYTVASNTGRYIYLSSAVNQSIPYDPTAIDPTYFELDCEITAFPVRSGVTIKLLNHHGIECHAKTYVDNVQVQQFGGQGIHLDTDYWVNEVANDTNVNYSGFGRIDVNSNWGHGVLTSGFNSNVIEFMQINARTNQGIGVALGDYHGTSVDTLHTSENRQGGIWRLEGQSHRDSVKSYYNEGGAVGNKLQNSLVLSGLHGAGFHHNSTHAQLDPVDGLLNMTPILIQTRKNTPATGYGGAYSIGGKYNDGGAGAHTLAAFGVGDEGASRAISGGRQWITETAHRLTHEGFVSRWFSWMFQTDTTKTSFSISDDRNELGPEQVAFSRGYYIGSLNGSQYRRWRGVDIAAPTSYKMLLGTRVSTSGTVVTIDLNINDGFRSHFDTSGGWTGTALITINGTEYTVSSVVSATQLILTTSAGSQSKVSATIKVPYQQGDSIDYPNPTPGGYKGLVCTTGGIPGTWHPYGLIVAPKLSYKENVGVNGAISSWVAEQSLWAGFIQDSWASPAPDTTGLTSPAPNAVYQDYRVGSSPVTYTKSGFAPGATVAARFHYCTYFAGNNYVFSITDTVGGGVVNETGYGGNYIARIKELTLLANSTGQISVTITPTGGSGYWIMSGIELAEQ